MASFGGLVRRLKKAIGLEQLPDLDPGLMQMERVFHAPPLTADLVAAIKLISPQFGFTTSEKHRRYWEADQNGACWGEYQVLAPVLRSIPKPERILEIGPGMGRSLVFFSKKLGWEGSAFHAFDGHGRSTRYTILGPRFEDSFCGNLGALRYVLEYNEVRGVTFINAHEKRLSEVAGPFDLLYSFYSIGFHWSLEHFLGDLLPLLSERGIAIFTAPQHFEAFPALDALPHRVLDWKPVWPAGARLKMIVLSKSPLPTFT